MKSLPEQLRAYGAYHQSVWNKASHFVGVPLVTFALFLFLGWFRFAQAPDLPLTAATVFYICVLLYYLCLDWRVGLLQAPFSLALLWLADRAALLPLGESVLVFAATFVGGWAVQLLGHALEGRRPALTDNLWQIFNAPLFLAVEVLTALGFYRHLDAPSNPTAIGADGQAVMAAEAKPDTKLQLKP
jgi:uncharacterized membrane protein YGL010W